MAILKKFEQNVENYVGAVKTRFVVVNGAQTTLNSKVADNQISIAGLDSSFKSFLEEYEEEISGVKGDISTVETNLAELIAKHNYDVSTIRKENDLNTAVQFASLNKTIDASFVEHMGYINTLNTSVAAIEAAMAQDNSRLDTSVSDIETSLAELIAKHNYDISTLQNTHNADIIANNVQLGKLMDASFVEHKGWIDDLSTSVSALETAMSQEDERIDGIDVSISGLETSLSALETTVSTLDSKHSADVSTLRNEIVMQTGVQFAALIKTIDASFVEHKGYIDSLNTSVSGLETTVSAIDSSLSALETKHDEELAIRDTSIAELVALLGTSTDTSAEPTIYGLFAKLNHIIEENEEVVANALVDMDQRINSK